MRARAIAFVSGTIAILICSAGVGTGAGFELMPSMAGLSSFGFPASFMDTALSGGQFSSPGAVSSLNSSTILPMLGQSMAGTSFLPAQSFSGTGISPSFSISDMLQSQSFKPMQDSFSNMAAPSSGAYGEANNGDTITVKLGDTIELQLPARIDQGYIWNLTVTDGLNVSNERVYTPLDMGSLFSGSGLTSLEVTMQWDIKALKPGTQVILGSYKSSAEKGPYDKTFKLTVIVEA